MKKKGRQPQSHQRGRQLEADDERGALTHTDDDEMFDGDDDGQGMCPRLKVGVVRLCYAMQILVLVALLLPSEPSLSTVGNEADAAIDESTSLAQHNSHGHQRLPPTTLI